MVGSGKFAQPVSSFPRKTNLYLKETMTLVGMQRYTYADGLYTTKTQKKGFFREEFNNGFFLKNSCYAIFVLMTKKLRNMIN
tara:strand:- start:8021 stop:8266 length:246 start_codon:yes stop_codon:yes gene_type:complete